MRPLYVSSTYRTLIENTTAKMNFLVSFVLLQLSRTIYCQQMDYCQTMDTYPDPALIRSNWQLVFNDDFNGASGNSVDLTKWNNKRTSAYDFTGQYAGGTRSPATKLDIIDPYRVYVDGNGWVVFDAWETNQSYPADTSKNFWNTGLLTTEWATTSTPFKLRTGDYIETVITFPHENGSWPGLWTWGVGNYGNTDPYGEVDTFEYHPDNPNTLEFTSHVHNINGDAKNFYNTESIKPGSGATLGTHYGEHAITWYLHGCRAYSTPYGQGVGSNFEAFVVLNLSIHSGVNKYHPGPNIGVNHMQFKADYVKVWRKNCNTDVVP